MTAKPRALHDAGLSRRFTALALASLFVLTGCSDDGDHREDASVPLRWMVENPNFDLCTTRLAYDAAVFAVDRPPVEETDPVGELRKVEAPSEVVDGWPDLIEAAAAAYEEGVEFEDITDGDLADRALLVARAVDHLVIETPCDPDGLPADAACGALIRDCAETLVRGDGRTFSTPFVSEVVAVEDWDVIECWDQQFLDERGITDIPTQPRCDLGHKVAGGGTTGNDVTISFMHTKDDRWIAWTLD